MVEIIELELDERNELEDRSELLELASELERSDELEITTSVERYLLRSAKFKVFEYLRNTKSRKEHNEIAFADYCDRTHSDAPQQSALVCGPHRDE